MNDHTRRTSRFAFAFLAAVACTSVLASPSLQTDSPLGHLRAKLRFSGDGAQATLDPASRLLLSRTAADTVRLQDVGLDFRDLYGVIHAETSWVPRDGLGRNGVVSQGLGQFEPATARAVGLRNPHDAVDAVHAAARLLKEAAVWSEQRVSRLALSPEQRAAKLREGVSIYYNLSTRARNTWSGSNTEQFPVETLRHIRNAWAGARQADQMHGKLGGPRLAPLPAEPPLFGARGAVSVVKSALKSQVPPKPQALGTIEWAGRPGDAKGRQSFVVWSNGTVQVQRGNEVPPGAIQWTRRS